MSGNVESPRKAIIDESSPATPHLPTETIQARLRNFRSKLESANPSHNNSEHLKDFQSLVPEYLRERGYVDQSTQLDYLYSLCWQNTGTSPRDEKTLSKRLERLMSPGRNILKQELLAIAKTLLARLIELFDGEDSSERATLPAEPTAAAQNAAWGSPGGPHRTPSLHSLMASQRTNTVQATGWVYFLVEHPWQGLVKIGKATGEARAGPWGRIRNETAGNPRMLVNWWSIAAQDPDKLERGLHAVLAHRQVLSGGGVEWYAMTLRELEAMRNLMTDGFLGGVKQEDEVFKKAQDAVGASDLQASARDRLQVFDAAMKAHGGHESELVRRAAMKQRTQSNRRPQAGYREYALQLPLDEEQEENEDVGETAEVGTLAPSEDEEESEEEETMNDGRGQAQAGLGTVVVDRVARTDPPQPSGTIVSE